MAVLASPISWPPAKRKGKEEVFTNRTAINSALSGSKFVPRKCLGATFSI